MPLTVNDLIFTKRTPDNVNDVYNILVTCGIWMKQKYGLVHWYPPYALEVMKHHADKYKVYSVEVPTIRLQQSLEEKLQQRTRDANTGTIVPSTNNSSSASSVPVSVISSSSSSSDTVASSSTSYIHSNSVTTDSTNSIALSSPLSSPFESRSTNTLVGTFTIGTETWVPYFRNDMWTDPSLSVRSLYLGKLAVLPMYHGYGIAKLILQQIDQLAKVKQCEYIRFDAIVRMPVLEPLYSSAGYQIVHRTAAPDASGTVNELYCFEKKIT